MTHHPPQGSEVITPQPAGMLFKMFSSKNHSFKAFLDEKPRGSEKSLNVPRKSPSLLLYSLIVIKAINRLITNSTMIIGIINFFTI